MTDWYSIWNSREGRSQSLADLINLDGFDVGAGRVAEEDWIDFVDCVARAANYVSSPPPPGGEQSLIEFGCGAGAFLYPLQRSYPDLAITGLDYSSTLLAHAQSCLPEATFLLCDLRQPLPDLPLQDHVVMHGVVHYLPADGVRLLLKSSFSLARRSIAVLGVPDQAFEQESEDARSSARPHGEYAKLYKDLKHTYFPRSFFETLCPQDWRIHWLQCHLNDANAPYRYSLIFRKRK